MRDYFLDRDFCESVIVTFFELTFNVAVEFLFFLEVNEVIVILRSIKEFSPYFGSAMFLSNSRSSSSWNLKQLNGLWLYAI